MDDIGNLERLNSFANNSPTVAGRAGADIASPAHRAAMFDANGDFVLADCGEKAVGLILSASPDPIGAGRLVHVLIKDIGLGEAGAAVGKGDLLSVDASGRLVPAADGDFVFGRAFSDAAAAGDAVQAQINPMGFLPS